MDKKKRIGIIVLILGLVTMAIGLVFMIVNLTAKPGLRDAEYLVTIGSWAREDEPSVVWSFTEVGQGQLTTNNHINDYDFIWAMDGGTLKIETDWLYDLNDEYAYKVDQENNQLILDETIVFVPAVTDTNTETDAN